MKRDYLIIGLIVVAAVGMGGCGKGGLAGYQNAWLHPQDVSTVYVEMFDSSGFRRGYEFKLTEAVCKRIEAQTPYKIVSDRDLADSVLSGTVGAGSGVLAGDRYTGRPLEQEAMIQVCLTWKNLKTGRLMLDNEEVYAAVSYSELLGQSYDYSAASAVNKAAQKVVELMEQPW
ncbi:MAG: hypothetical protein GX298_06795 [Planctomycetes bacterium]|nr:hypothetical protein [Planctomycetota bacterium]